MSISRSILLVDDEPAILEELCELLSAMDYRCICAGSVDAALEKVAIHTDIALVMTDMRMPGRDGADLVRTLASDASRRYEFVVISGHMDSDTEMAELDRLPVQRLRKPINAEELMALLDRLPFAE